jgi:hypothetical protein
VVTWRRAQMVLLSAQGMPVARIAEVSFTSAGRVRDVIHNFDMHGFASLYPKYKGGRHKSFTLPERREIKTWAAADNVEVVYTPTNSSWLNRIEAQFTPCATSPSTAPTTPDHKEQGSMIRRYIICRNRHADDRRLRALVDRANVA